MERLLVSFPRHDRANRARLQEAVEDTFELACDRGRNRRL